MARSASTGRHSVGSAASRCRRPAARRQRGIALLLVLLGIMLASSYLLLNGFNPAYAKLERDRVTRDALLQAKQALITRAAMDANLPGSLPCPSTDELGTASIACTPFGAPPANTLIGRLPWRTLNLPPLVDASGELLWYALSANFRDQFPTVKINADQPLGTLQVRGADGTIRDKYVVAVIFAPGAALPGQVRAGPARNVVGNYLEGDNNHLNPDPACGSTSGTNDFVFAAEPRDGCTLPFNDAMVIITRDELMAAVENAVALRAERAVGRELQRFVATWGSMPFAVPAPFDPDATLLGTAGTRIGGVPIGPTVMTWAGVPNVNADPLLSDLDEVGGTLNINFGGTSCMIVGTDMRCTIAYTGSPSFTLALEAQNAAFAFPSYREEGWDGCTAPFPDADDTAYRNANPSLLRSTAVPADAANPQAPLCSPTPPPVDPIPQPYIQARTLLADGRARMVYTGRLPSGASPYVLTVPAPVPSFVMSTSNTSPLAWFFANGWHKQSYYAVSAGFVPGQSARCSPIDVGQPDCLTVRRNGTDRPAAVLLLLGGSPLNAEAGGVQGRRGLAADPPWIATPAEAVGPAPGVVNVFQYVDSLQNQNLADDIFEERPRSRSFNDRIVQLIPTRP